MAGTPGGDPTASTRIIRLIITLSWNTRPTLIAIRVSLLHLVCDLNFQVILHPKVEFVKRVYCMRTCLVGTSYKLCVGSDRLLNDRCGGKHVGQNFLIRRSKRGGERQFGV